MELSDEKKQLIEEVGIHLEERANLSPLASRIYALLILSSYDGMSFEKIVNTMQASKSSVSSNINVLLQLHFIEYYTKPGDRKRYFRTSDFYLKNTMEQQAHSLEKALRIVQKVNHFNADHNPEKFKKERSMGSLYESHLNEQIERINHTLTEIEKLKQ
ncbi:hypothetical protein DFQ11_101159 [Winogradskyella epiphytica]|uniref:DNA-binding transcriptional regulator GbsR (MarR family) n=1 Tax=Winogradskyella epiphytica TaxID=262005 RepID=A0A2V4Y1N4_9FLAO|nr:hypothetical protein [Winogradskyella epiphytica]PYE82734.1 hypothetical protein DFQ11_101159 [Winogradskyella epiphytica]GGW53270.1 hypothetical protein GCM10008085_00390 [Winogradskyella epiphytica]